MAVATESNQPCDELSSLHSITLERSQSYVRSLDPAEARIKLQEEMDRIWTLLNSIQGLHNSLSSFIKLPDELLVEIGWALYQMLTPSWKVPPSDGLNLLNGFLPLTKICHHLRRLYLSSPRFWTLIDLQTPMAAACIQRSGNLPLYVVCNSIDGTVPELLPDLVEAAMSRARALQFDADCVDTMLALLHTIETQPLPHLRELSLKVVKLPHAQRSESLPHFDPNYGDGKFQPRLDTLLLRGVILRYPSPLYVGLKRLELTSLSGTLIPTEQDLSSLLQNCPDLVHLSIQGTGPEFTESGTLPQPILLEHLVTLNLSHHLRNIHCIIALIRCPSLRLLTISVLHTTMRDTFGGIFAPGSQLLEKIRRKSGKKVGISGGFTCVNSLDYDSSIIAGDGLKFSIGVTTPRHLFGNMAEVFGSTECLELVVSADGGKPYPATAGVREWIFFFNAFPNLRKLGLHRLPDFGNPLCALKPSIQRSVDTLPCLKLSHMEVSGFKVNMTGCGWADELRSLAELRAQRGSPLEVLKVTGILSEYMVDEVDDKDVDLFYRFEDTMKLIDGLVADFSWELREE